MKARESSLEDSKSQGGSDDSAMRRGCYADTLVRDEMQSMFDPHIKSMLKKVREQLDFVQLKAFGNPQVVSRLISPTSHYSLTASTEILNPLGRPGKLGLRERLPPAGS